MAEQEVRGGIEFLAELRRRRVFRVLLAYGVASFAILQVVEPVMHGLHLPEWVLSLSVVALGLGFPVAIGLAWAFDLTPSGVERTPDATGPGGRPAVEASRAWPLLVGMGLLAAAPGLAWYFVWRNGSGEARMGVALAGGATALAIAVLAFRLRRPGPVPSPTPAAAPVAGATPASPDSIAVLPFVDLSPGQDQGHFCDGIADELLTALSTVPGLRVAARGSSFQFKGRDVDGREVGRTLGVATTLEGSVRKSGNRVRVSARLCGTTDGFQLWSETHDRNLDDIFAIQEEIAQAVVRALRPRLGGADGVRLTRAGTQSTPAYEMYLRGRQFLMTLSDNGYRFARQMFRGAIELDPTFAQAHAGLADTCYFMLAWHLDDDHVDAIRAEAAAASAEAVRLDPSLAEAHVARGNVLSSQRREAEADAEFRRALELNPSLPHAHYFFARHLFETGRRSEAAAQFEETVRLDPEDLPTWVLIATLQLGLGNREAAAAAGRRAIAAAAVRLRLFPDDVRALYMVGGAEINFGDRQRGLDYLARALELAPGDFATLYNSACGYVHAGEHERALDALDRAVGTGKGSRRWFENDSDLDPLRSHPRFQEILSRLKA
jgi:TolB-like protein/tetratricopeptide (TPR) repeat protein